MPFINWAATGRRRACSARRTRRCGERSNGRRRADRGHAGRDRFRRTPTDGRISAKRLLPSARTTGYEGSARNFRRAVARVKAEWRQKRRIFRPWVASPGQHLVIDWTSIMPGLHMFCAVLAWSRYPRLPDEIRRAFEAAPAGLMTGDRRARSPSALAHHPQAVLKGYPATNSGKKGRLRPGAGAGDLTADSTRP